ncbi:MAG: DMT family transporter [Xanthomonadales bacterium]|nr:DMT family transporter [Xanthomonadales bacterium]
MSVRIPALRLLAAALALAGFAANSLLCRAALAGTGTDPASFTALRLASGAVVLGLLVLPRQGQRLAGNWRAALWLFAYAALFSWAYLGLTAATGALLLFAAVQVTVAGTGLLAGERPGVAGLAGLLLAMAGVVVLLLPGLAAPSPLAAGAMLAAGVAWGLYTLRGRGSRAPLADTAGNFLRTLPMAVALLLIAWPGLRMDGQGALLAVLSGALASGIGYALWYAALPWLPAVTAASLQLTVPVLTAVAGAVLLAEALTLRVAVAGAMVLAGIAMVLVRRRRC